MRTRIVAQTKANKVNAGELASQFRLVKMSHRFT